MRISDWSSDVCSSDLMGRFCAANQAARRWAWAWPLSTSGRSVRAPMRRASALLSKVLPWRMMKMRRMGCFSTSLETGGGSGRGVAVGGDEGFDAGYVGLSVDAGTVEDGRRDRDGGDGDAEFEQAELFQAFEGFEGRGGRRFEAGKGVERVGIGRA